VPRRAVATLALLLVAALLAGCGGSSVPTEETRELTFESEAGESPGGAPPGAAARSCEALAADAEALRATGLSCERARRAMHGWQREPACALPADASRGGCRASGYRCQALRGDRGVAVSCARAGESIAFIARRG
jgi:hypothetical protein